MSRISARFGARSLVAFAVSVVLVGGVQALPAAASGQAPCDSVAATDAQAGALAVRCGQDVEVLDARTEWNTLYAQPDGQMRLKTSTKAVRANVSGQWRSVDTALVAGPQGVSMVAPAVQMVFSDGAKGQPLVRMTRDGHDLTFDVPFDLPVPVLSDSTLQYSNVAPGVDLLVTVEPDGSGFSEVLRVASPSAAADPRIADLAFPISTSKDLALKPSSDGGLTADDASGKPVFTSPVPQMWDSRTDDQTPVVSANFASLSVDSAAGFGLTQGLQANRAARVHGPLGVDRSANLPAKLSAGKVKVAADAGILSDPQTVWPVYIDPGFRAGYPGDRIVVSDVGVNNWNFTGNEGMGHCGTTGSPMYCNRVFTTRLVWQFYGLARTGGATVTNATLSAYGAHSYSCTPYPVEAWWTGGINSASTFGSIAWLARLSSQSLSHKAACNNQRWIPFDVTGGAQQTANAHADQLTVGLKATDETSSTGWKRYGYDAALDITYNNPPNTPTGLAFSWPSAVGCGATINSPNPVLVASAGDPDADSVYTVFQVANSGGVPVWSVGTGWQGSGSQFGVQVPSGVLADAASYYFSVYAVDTSGRTSAWSGACWFTANTVPPSTQPLITPQDGQPAKYVAGERHGGIGLTGAFLLDANGVGDVRSFKYGFDDPAMPKTVGLNTPISYTPTTAGPHTLYAQSVDVGGLVGPPRDYTFTVDVAGTAGLWAFDESGAPASATDSSGAGHPLTLSSSALRVQGMLRDLDDLAPVPDDALHFAALTDQAISSVPVVATAGSFTVTAFVKLDDLTGAQTVVSQDALDTSAFELGLRPAGDPVCTTGGPCWAFTLASADSPTSPGGVVATSTVPVVAGQWVFLAATFNAGGGAAQLYVADPGGQPVSDGPVIGATGLFSTGNLVVGHGRAADASAHGLHGSVDIVRVLTGVASASQLNQYALGSLTL